MGIFVSMALIFQSLQKHLGQVSDLVALLGSRIDVRSRANLDSLTNSLFILFQVIPVTQLS